MVMRKKGDEECPNCGLIYAKHEEMLTKKEAEKAEREANEKADKEEVEPIKKKVGKKTYKKK